MEGGFGDMVVTQTITVTRPIAADDIPSVDIAIYCTPLEFSGFARSYVDGVRLYTPINLPQATGRRGRRQEREHTDAGVDGQRRWLHHRMPGRQLHVRRRRQDQAAGPKERASRRVSMHTVLELAQCAGARSGRRDSTVRPSSTKLTRHSSPVRDTACFRSRR